jgi:cob(I)alamin adenosyltransferase
MPIYTKTGDKGETSLFGGKRISKGDSQIEAYGSVDELTSILGMVAVKIRTKNDKDFIVQTQHDLYEIMGFLAGYNSPIENIYHRVTFFEQKIDQIESQLPKLHKFIIPGGTEIAAWFHIARTVCRRVERNIVNLQKDTTLDKEKLLQVVKYINRLSDLFFDLARWYSEKKEILT